MAEYVVTIREYVEEYQKTHTLAETVALCKEFERIIQQNNANPPVGGDATEEEPFWDIVGRHLEREIRTLIHEELVKAGLVPNEDGYIQPPERD